MLKMEKVNNVRSRSSARCEIDRMYNALECDIKVLADTNPKYQKLADYFLHRKSPGKYSFFFIQSKSKVTFPPPPIRKSQIRVERGTADQKYLCGKTQQGRDEFK